jgi:hypothetical protein
VSIVRSSRDLNLSLEILAPANTPGWTEIGAHVTDANRQLLVVDDEPIQRLIVTRAVESLGFAVDGATELRKRR